MDKEFKTKIKLKKFKKREISPFFGQNFLYEYLQNLLDEERKKAVEEVIHSDKNTQSDFMKMTNGLQYVELLSEVVISDKIVDQTVNRNTSFHKILNKIKFDRWPLSIKWTLEALIIILAMVITLNVFPWGKIVHLASEDQNKDMIITKIDRKKKELLNAGSERSLKEVVNAKPEFIDEGIKLDSKKVSLVKIPFSVKNSIEIKSNEPNQEKPVVQNSTDISNAKTTGGFLYRGQLQVTNVEMIAPKISDKIFELGGRKAGEVEIGWKKSNQTFYYHFTLPKSKLPELESLLKIYSELKLKKEPHARVMPDGILRIIFTIDEKSTTSGSP